ncbi:MAG: SCO family protein [Anaerolineales bacterium]
MRLKRGYLILLALWLAGCSGSYEWNGSPYEPASEAPEITLADTSGQPFHLSDKRGDIILVYFGYTYCPDICPATLAELAWVMEQLGSDAENLQVVFISVDPARDTPERVDSYLAKFDPDFVGLVGSEQELEKVTAAYGVLAQRDPGDEENYTMTHTSRVFLIDNEGMLRTNYTFDEPPEAILADVEHLLSQ